MPVSKLSPKAKKVLSLLLREIPQEQKKLLLEEISDLEQSIAQLSTSPLNTDAAEKIFKGRTSPSASLSRKIEHSEEKRHAARTHWLAANNYVLSAIGEGRSFNLTDIQNINALVLGLSQSHFRTTPASVEDQFFVDPQDVSLLMDSFITLLNSRAFFHPLEKAAFIYQWLISIHPFEDGNGRTARLICDWTLTLEGQQPLSFEHELDSNVAVFADRLQNYSPEDALRTIIRGVKNSALCLWT